MFTFVRLAASHHIRDSTSIIFLCEFQVILDGQVLVCVVFSLHIHTYVLVPVPTSIGNTLNGLYLSHIVKAYVLLHTAL